MGVSAERLQLASLGSEKSTIVGQCLNELSVSGGIEIRGNTSIKVLKLEAGAVALIANSTIIQLIVMGKEVHIITEPSCVKRFDAFFPFTLNGRPQPAGLDIILK